MLGKRIFLYLFLYLILNISYAQRMPTLGEVWSNAERRVYENEILRQQARTPASQLPDSAINDQCSGW